MKKFIILLAIPFLFSCAPEEMSEMSPMQKTSTEILQPGQTDPENNPYYLLYKKGLFELVNKATGKTSQLQIDEAERLLRMPKTDWQIAAEAPYLFSFENGLRFNFDRLK